MLKQHRHTSATKSDLPTNQLGRVPVRRVNDASRHAAPFELTFYVSGKRKRSFHASEEEAVKAWREHKRLEKKFGTLPYLFDADAQRSYDTAIRLLAGRVTIEEAVRYFLAHAPENTAPLLSSAIADFLAAKERLARSDVHVRNLKVLLNGFVKHDRRLANATVSQVGQAHVSGYCLAPGIAARTSVNRRNTLSSFFGWAIRQKWIVESPTAFLTDADMPSRSRAPKVILSPAQAGALLSAMRELAPDSVPWIAVQLFAGIRDAEASRLTDAMIDRERSRIRIPAAICKTDDDWIMTRLPGNLWAWLPKGCTFVEPHHFHWKRVLARLAALPDDHLGLLLPAWPYNAARRSFCTYHITEHGDAVATASLLRHSSPARLYKSYLGALRTEDEAREYFSLTPHNLPSLPPTPALPDPEPDPES